MTPLVALDILAAEWLASDGVWTVWFEAGYPGETFCRCQVRLRPEAGDARGLGSRADVKNDPADPLRVIVAVARDALLEALQAEGRPVSLVLGVDAAGWAVLERGYPGS